MARVLIIGAGGVGSVVAHKCASVPEVFTEIMLASRTKAKCDAIAAQIGGNRIQTAQVDADNVEETIRLLESYKPDLLINVGVYIPEHLDKDERKLIEQLQDSKNIAPGSADKKNFFRNLFGI